MRRYREVVQIGLPLLGMAVLFASVLMVPAGQRIPQLTVVLVGILILEAGVWGLTHPLMPEERHYLALREEGDFFITLIRELNAKALDENRHTEAGEKSFQETLALMHLSVEHMAVVAGISDEDLALEDEREEAGTTKAEADADEADEGSDAGA